MEEKNKKLLLKDLCARLPYGVHIYSKVNDKESNEVLDVYKLSIIQIWLEDDDDVIIKPYLRPMSSMTEDEYEQYRKFSYYGAAGYRNNDYKEMIATPSFEKMDFLNVHHFDYRGLLEKGLALEAPEGMYKFN